MLESQEKREQNWHAIVKSEKRCCSTFFLHEGEVGLEKKGIIVGSDQSIPAKISQFVRYQSVENRGARIVCTWW